MKMHVLRSYARARCRAIVTYGVNGVWSAPFGLPSGYVLCERCIGTLPSPTKDGGA